jgi:hypothetical protein
VATLEEKVADIANMEPFMSKPTRLVQAVIDLQVEIAELREHSSATINSPPTPKTQTNLIELDLPLITTQAGHSGQKHAAQPVAPTKSRKGKEIAAIATQPL